MSAMGDIIHSLPVAARLKQILPGVEIGWVVEPLGVPLLLDNPAVDNVHLFEKKKWWQQLRSVSEIPATAGEFNSFIGAVRDLKYDAAIDLQGLMKSSLLSFFSGAPLRFGFKGTREGAEHLLTHRLDVGDYFGSSVHIVDLNLRLADLAANTLLNLVSQSIGTPAGAIGSPGGTASEEGSFSKVKDFEASAGIPGSSANGTLGNTSHPIYKEGIHFPLPLPSDTEINELRRLLAVSATASSPEMVLPPSVTQAPPLVLIPGTTWQSKIWPTEHWIELGKACLATISDRLVLVGGPAEVELNASIARALGPQAIDLTARTSLRQLIALFASTKIVVGADTGPLHLAAAVGQETGVPRVLGVFGSTPIHRNGPYGQQSRSINLNLSCQPCFEKICPLGTLACLIDLKPDAVFQAVRSMAGGELS